MRLWQRLQYLRPSYRRAQEQDMQAELESIAAMAEPGELGNLTRTAEEARAVWSWTWLEQLARDLQYALRTLRHNPGFTATAVLSLALGIGANTAIFGLIDALMLRWLPVKNPQELVQLMTRSPGQKGPADGSFSYAIVTELAAQTDVFSNLAGLSGWTFDVGPRGAVARVQGEWVSGAYYETLGLTPAIGRLLGPADDRPGAPLAAVISYGYWERQYSRSPAALGQSIFVNGIPVTIVGVSQRGFSGANVGSPADINLPLQGLPTIEPSMAGLLGPGNFWLRILARPRQGISLPQASARLNARWPGIAQRAISPNWTAPRRKEAEAVTFELKAGGTGMSYLRELFSKPLLVLMAVAGLVLLIACANVASLLLARASAREREISVRLAIGAGRGRIIRQLLTESTLLSAIGALLGIWLAWVSSRLLVATLERGDTQVIFDLAPNWHILGFACAVALLNGVVFGLAPAFQTTALGRRGVLREDTRMTHSRSRLLSSLVSAQVALSLLLLVGAGLFVRTLQNLLGLDPGFRREGVLLVNLDGKREGYREVRLTEFYSGLLDRVRRVPGVESASISSHTPLNGWTWTEAAVPKGQPVPQRDNAVFIAAGPQYFATMRTPLLAGREFNEGDRGDAKVAIVNQAYAQQHFPGRSPVGEFLTTTVTNPPADWQIVGVAKDSMNASLRNAARPTVYVSYFQRQSGTDSLEIRAAGSLSQVAAAIRQELQPSFPNTPVNVQPFSAQVAQTLVQERLMAKLAGGFGALGMLLACVGLYGLLAYTVVRQTKEIGIRMALGARPRTVRWMVARRALVLVALGVVAGLPIAWALSQKVKSMLFGLTGTDPAVIGIAVLVLAAAGLVAAYFPSRRASQVDPMTALRHD
jgi:predicted permease